MPAGVEYEIIKVEKRSIPSGARLVEAYETERQIVVMGDPPHSYPATLPEEMRHSCDRMGCGSGSHVLYRFYK
jgi:hypothetical protein